MNELITLLILILIGFGTYWLYFNGGCSKGGLHKWIKLTTKRKEISGLYSSTKECKKCGLIR